MKVITIIMKIMNISVKKKIELVVWKNRIPFNAAPANRSVNWKILQYNKNKKVNRFDFLSNRNCTNVTPFNTICAYTHILNQIMKNKVNIYIHNSSGFGNQMIWFMHMQKKIIKAIRLLVECCFILLFHSCFAHNLFYSLKKLIENIYTQWNEYERNLYKISLQKKKKLNNYLAFKAFFSLIRQYFKIGNTIS